MNVYLKAAGLIVTTLLISCSSLPKLSNVSPETVNLSGEWVLNQELSQTVVMSMPSSKSGNPKGRKKGQSPGGGGGGGGKGGRGGPPKGEESNGGDFASFSKPASMSAKQMKIDQGADGMGILYPQKPYRDVNWGKIEVRRNTVTSGWNGEQLMVHTKGGRQEYTEVYSINSAADTLTVTFLVDGIDGKQEFVRVYKLKGGQ